MPEWQRFKYACAQAQREVKLSYQYESSAIADYRFLQGSEWYRSAKLDWEAALLRVLGGGRVEWISTNPKAPVCLVNGIMMFS